MCVDVSFVIFKTEVEATRFFVLSESVRELLLLSLDFIFACMNAAIRKLPETETVDRRLDNCTSVTMEKLGEFLSHGTNACKVGSMTYGGNPVVKPYKKYSCEMKLLKESDSGGVNIANVMLRDIPDNVGYNSGIGVEIADFNAVLSRSDSKLEARNYDNYDSQESENDD